MSRRCFIFGALDVAQIPEYPAQGDYVIAADRGYDVAVSLGVKPDLVVGDFDSRGTAPDFPDLVRLNVRKDDTDVGHAIELAMDKGYRDFVIYGAVGGRLDHTVANIQLASLVADRGGSAVFCGEQNLTVIRNAAFSLPLRDSGRVSVFALSEQAYGVQICGLSYELHDGVLTRNVPLGVSNAFVGKQASVSVEDGELLIIWDA